MPNTWTCKFIRGWPVTKDRQGLTLFKLLVFGLSHSGSLYANDLVLDKSCTSFAITPTYLIFTTVQHLLKFVHLTDLNGKLSWFFNVLWLTLLQSSPCHQMSQNTMSGAGLLSVEPESSL